MDRDQYRQELIDKHAKKTGLRGKVDAFCIHCIFDPYAEGSWRKQVTECTANNCPLYSVRPLSTVDYQETDDG